MTPRASCIAVVDDDAAVRSALTRLLSAAGFEVTAFASAEQFLLHVSNRPFDCLLLDVHLPGLTGLELSRRLERTGGGPPIVFLTGDPHVARSAEIRETGHVCLIKPADDQALLAVIGKAIRPPEAPS